MSFSWTVNTLVLRCLFFNLLIFMKELLEKFLWLFSEWVSKMEEAKTEEAIKKFKEASEMSESLTKKAEENSQEVDLKKFFESDDWKEALKKYVDMYLSANDISSFVAQIKELAGSTETLTKKVEELEKQKEKDDETVSEALDKTMDEVEEIKKTLETRVSKIS